MLPVKYETFNSVDIRVGTVKLAERAEGIDITAYQLAIDFGAEIGTKKSLAQLTHYSEEALVGRQVLAVVNFQPKQIGPHRSEVLVLAVPTQDQGSALVVPDMEATVGGRLF